MTLRTAPILGNGFPCPARAYHAGIGLGHELTRLPAPPDAMESAEAGEVVYLTPGVALVPADVAAAGEAAVRALEDAADAQAVADWRPPR